MPDQRLTWLTRRPTLWSAVVPLVAVGAGVLFATSATTAKGTDLRSSSSDLPGIIREQTRTNAQQAEKVRALQVEVDRLSTQQAPGDDRVGRLTREAERLSLAAGTQAVSGPTVTVSLTDSKIPLEQLPDSFGVNDVVVHQQDVQAVVNTLWRGGAEAMMLMDQRVISTSAVRCVGNTLILQGRVYSPPYVIKAMGDPTALQQALSTSPEVQRYLEYVDAVGLGYTVDTAREETFPAYAGSVNLRHAQAAP
jgi:uncharacterized protein YlxW (UPF0749 family)